MLYYFSIIKTERAEMFIEMAGRWLSGVQGQSSCPGPPQCNGRPREPQAEEPPPTTQQLHGPIFVGKAQKGLASHKSILKLIEYIYMYCIIFCAPVGFIV